MTAARLLRESACLLPAAAPSFGAGSEPVTITALPTPEEAIRLTGGELRSARR